MVFCNNSRGVTNKVVGYVTILILIDGFLQSRVTVSPCMILMRHNPYFNRWFSAISISKKEDKTIKNVTILILIDGFLQYTLCRIS